MVIYLSLSLITGYETFNNWHFTRSVLNHFVSRLSFIGLHTIIALGLHGLKRSKCIFSWGTSPSSMVAMSNSHHVSSLVSFKYLEKGKTVAKVQIPHSWKLQSIRKREALGLEKKWCCTRKWKSLEVRWFYDLEQGFISEPIFHL